MRRAIQRKLSAHGPSREHRRDRDRDAASASASLPSSSAYGDSDVGSSSSGSYSYYSEGSDSYRAGSSSYSSTSVSTASEAASIDTAGSAGAASDVLTPFSAYVRAADRPESGTFTTTTTPTAMTPTTPSPMSSFDRQRAASGTASDGAKAKAGAGTSAAALTTATSTTVNGITVDDADALVRPLRSPSLASSPSSPLMSPPSGDAAASVSRLLAVRPSLTRGGGGGPEEAPGAGWVCPVSPYHFSEEELLLARPSFPADGDGTSHTSGEGHGGAGGGGGGEPPPDVVDTIHTVPIAVPPSPEEARRRRDGGSMPFPTHLTFRIVPHLPATVRDPQPPQQELDGEGNAKEKKGAVKARKTTLTSCGGFFSRRRAKAREAADERATARQQSHRNALRSHHVPLVNFRTTRERPPHGGDGGAPLYALPTVEEAAGYRMLEDDVMGTEARPRMLREAMRQQHRPASGLRLNTFYAFGRRAGGGPRGGGQSAFMHENDPQRFWVAHLHERAHVHLEPIETE